MPAQPKCMLTCDIHTTTELVFWHPRGIFHGIGLMLWDCCLLRTLFYIDCPFCQFFQGMPGFFDWAGHIFVALRRRSAIWEHLAYRLKLCQFPARQALPAAWHDHAKIQHQDAAADIDYMRYCLLFWQWMWGAQLACMQRHRCGKGTRYGTHHWHKRLMPQSARRDSC